MQWMLAEVGLVGSLNDSETILSSPSSIITSA